MITTKRLLATGRKRFDGHFRNFGMRETGKLLEQARAAIAANRLAEARDAYRAICEIRRADQAAWLMLGKLDAQLGRLADAELDFREALAISGSGSQPEIYHALGTVLEAQGRLDEAIECFRKAVLLKPGFVAACNDLGVALQTAGRLEEAATSYAHTLRLKPDFAIASYNLGTVLKDLGRFDEAIGQFESAVLYRPHYPEAYNAMGLVQQAQGELADASRSYLQAIELAPNYADACGNLANVCKDTGLLDQALEFARRAVRLLPQNPALHVILGNVYRQIGDLDGALLTYRRAGTLSPGYEDALAGEAAILDLKGQRDAAFRIIDPLVTAGCRHPNVTTVYAALGKTSRRQREAISILKKSLEEPGLWSAQRSRLHFQLGQLYDSLAQYDRAFEHFSLGNTIKGQCFDAEAHSTFIDLLIKTFDQEFLAQAPRPAQLSDRPVFIVGMPRSGTSLIEQILASHPQVHGAGELREINRIAVQLRDLLGMDDARPACATRLSPDLANAMSQQYLGLLSELAPDARRVTDKMPTNFLHLGLIGLLFPAARIIHCKRDPRDTCLSCYFHDFSGVHPYAYDLQSLGAYYVQYRRLMAHWAGTLSIPIKDVVYEEVIDAPETTIREIVDFSGLDWDRRCLSFHQTERVTRTASYNQVRQPIYSSAVCKWKHYEEYIEPLTAALQGVYVP